MLQLQNNFNLRGALGTFNFSSCDQTPKIFYHQEFSLNEYKTIHKVPETGNTKILHHLINDTEYQGCLADVTKRYQLQTADINACASTLYHELSKHAHGNTAELAVIGSEQTITEVAALEAVFCALKKKGCFSLPMKFYLRCVAAYISIRYLYN